MMSHIALEEVRLMCPLEGAFKGAIDLAGLSFVDEVFRTQANTAQEELGDTLVLGKDVMREVQERAETDLGHDKAVVLFAAANSCLQQRYLGNCAMVGVCIGRDKVDKRLAGLGIQRYKDIDLEK